MTQKYLRVEYSATLTDKYDSKVLVGKAAGVVTAITLAALTAVVLSGGTSVVEAGDTIALLNEDDFKGKLEKLTYDVDSGNESSLATKGEKTIVVPSSTESTAAVSPTFGIILIAIAFIYLVVLLYQVFNAQRRAGRRYDEYSDSELSRLNSSQRSDLESFTTVPNTCSYTESQLCTPNQSVYSVEHNVPMPQFGSQLKVPSELSAQDLKQDSLARVSSSSFHSTQRGDIQLKNPLIAQLRHLD